MLFSGDCNNLADTVTAELRFAGMNVFDLVPISSGELMEEAQKHGTKALIPNI